MYKEILDANHNLLLIIIKKNIVIDGVLIVEGTSYDIYDYTKPKLKEQKDCIKKMLESEGVILEVSGRSESLPQSIYCDEVKLKAAIAEFVNNRAA